ncbi:MAG: DNA/RNA nuclease SfsA [Gammaproteobacteria bacterium]|nr:DNA/RNA nuclease SfsA [Gammaproteobacteria bacterium]
MKFDQPLQQGILIKRYKRFLADVEFPNGEVITAHSPNTGSMLGCCAPGRRVWLRDSNNPKRKCRFGWEMIEVAPDNLVGINTGLSNTLVSEAIEAGVITELQGYESIRQEVKYGNENSRIDLLLQGDDRPDCYVEIKNVTAANKTGMAFFPDAVSARGTKHLRELMAMVDAGYRAVLIFSVQRADVNAVRPADEIDPLYGKTLREALANGVEVIAYGARISPDDISLERSLPVLCPASQEEN